MSVLKKSAYKEFYEHSQDGILIMEEFNFIDCNKAILKMLGYKNKKELLNIHPSKLSPEYQPDGQSSFTKAQDMMNICNDLDKNRFDWVYKKANGESFWVEIVLSKLQVGDKNYIHMSWRDIHNRKSLEQSISKKIQKNNQYIVENEQYKQAIDNYMIVSKTDKKGIITSVNKAFCKISGYTENELIGHSHSIIRHPEMKKEVFKELWATIQDGQIWTGNVKNIRKNGEAYYVRSMIIPVFDELSNICEYVSIREDISSIIEEKDRAIAYQKSKDLLLSKVSHELRTPLTGINGFAQILQNSNDKSKIQEHSKLISIESKRLLKLIDNLLDSSKLETEHFTLVPTTTNIYMFIAYEINFFENMVEEKGITLIPKINIYMPQWVYVDAERLKQVIHNLLSNAIKYTPQGGVIIFEVLFNNDEFEFIIKDNGPGIDENSKDEIFKAFSQVNEEDQFSGTGLGLSIASAIVKKMGSKIFLHSIIGEGSTFSFKIKVDEVKSNPSLKQKICNYKINIDNLVYKTPQFREFFAYHDLHITQDTDEKDIIICPRLEHISELYSSLYQCELLNTEVINENLTFKLKVLIAEDYKTNQILIRSILENVGVEVDIADDGKKAFILYENNDYDLILSDINMPQYDGYYFAKKLQNANSKVPFYALSADVTIGDTQEYKKAKFDGSIFKPIDTNELFNIIKSIDKVDCVLENKITLSKKLNLPEKVISKIIFTYINDIQLDIEGMNEAYNKKDLYNLAKIVHKIKGASGTLMQTLTHKTCLDMEKNIKQSNYANLQACIDIISEATKKLKQESK